MPSTNFEAAQAVLKAHPGAQPVTPRRRRGRQAPNGPPPNPERHSRKCRICKRPDREGIETDFLRWRPTAEIAQTYGLPDHSSVCRHARATGLYDLRSESICYALDPLLEQADVVTVKMTPSTLISAVAAYSKINNRGRRTRPVVHTHRINVSSAEFQELFAAAPGNPVSHRSPLVHTESAGGGRRVTRHCCSPAAVAANRPIQELEGTPTC